MSQKFSMALTDTVLSQPEIVIGILALAYGSPQRGEVKPMAVRFFCSLPSSSVWTMAGAGFDVGDHEKRL